MKKWIALAMAAWFLLVPNALPEDIPEGTDFAFDFMDEGYEGRWVQIDPLGIEFCLPEGWTEQQPAGDAVYAATAPDGQTSLNVYRVEEGVADPQAWGETHLKEYETAVANFYDALIVEEEHSIQVYIATGEDLLVRFEYTRPTPGALDRDAALRIIETVCDLWVD